jgi:hypothetical protein
MCGEATELWGWFARLARNPGLLTAARMDSTESQAATLIKVVLPAMPRVQLCGDVAGLLFYELAVDSPRVEECVDLFGRHVEDVEEDDRARALPELAGERDAIVELPEVNQLSLVAGARCGASAPASLRGCHAGRRLACAPPQ